MFKLTRTTLEEPEEESSEYSTSQETYFLSMSKESVTVERRADGYDRTELEVSEVDTTEDILDQYEKRQQNPNSGNGMKQLVDQRLD